MTDCAPLPGMVGRHPSMRAVYALVRKVAPTDLPVVIVGETGTGKELVARAVHELSAYREGPFVDLNCAAVPETLAEAELFGWERGAFTGAVRECEGLLETAAGGTLFLDEACSLPRVLQAKLLRAIEQQGFRRLGGRRHQDSGFRLVLAVSTPLDALVAAGTFRDDFAFRVAGVTVQLPRLQERGEDVVLLAEHFLESANGNGYPTKCLAAETVRLFRQHSWAGNVRELRTLIERVGLLTDGPVIDARAVRAARTLGRSGTEEPQGLGLALEAHGWNVSAAARDLGISRTTVYAAMRRHGLERPNPRSS